MTAGSCTFLVVFFPCDLMMACAAFELAVLRMVKNHRFFGQIHLERPCGDGGRSGKGGHSKSHDKRNKSS